MRFFSSVNDGENAIRSEEHIKKKIKEKIPQKKKENAEGRIRTHHRNFSVSSLSAVFTNSIKGDNKQETIVRACTELVYGV